MKSRVRNPKYATYPPVRVRNRSCQRAGAAGWSATVGSTVDSPLAVIASGIRVGVLQEQSQGQSISKIISPLLSVFRRGYCLNNSAQEMAWNWSEIGSESCRERVSISVVAI